ncbi:MAG: hypothetical protein AAF489_17230 [Bacteroidota bacterium]
MKKLLTTTLLLLLSFSFLKAQDKQSEKGLHKNAVYAEGFTIFLAGSAMLNYERQILSGEFIALHARAGIGVAYEAVEGMESTPLAAAGLHLILGKRVSFFEIGAGLLTADWHKQQSQTNSPALQMAYRFEANRQKGVMLKAGISAWAGEGFEFSVEQATPFLAIGIGF